MSETKLVPPPFLHSTLYTVASYVIPAIVPTPVMGGAGLVLIRLGRVRAGSFILLLSAGVG
jgi:hypothetical protein